jgi:cytochrome c-type biogenesis protein
MNLSYLIAFGAGMLYFVSPCFLPLVPSYLSYIAGISLNEMKESKANLKIVFLNVLLFVLGFSSIFIILGISASAIGMAFIQYKSIIEKIGGVIIIFLGIYLLFQTKFSKLLITKNFLPSIKPAGLIGSFIVGAAFSIGFTPCATPVLSTIIIYTSTQATLKKGIVLLFLFSLGLGLPLIISGLSLSFFLNTFQRIKKYLRTIEILTAILLIIFGFLIYLGGVSKISYFLTGGKY